MTALRNTALKNTALKNLQILWALPALLIQGCLPGTAVYPAQLIIPYEALARPLADPACVVGANAESSLSRFVDSTYPAEERNDQYRSRLLSSLEELPPGGEIQASVGYSVTTGSIRLERSTSHPLSLIDTCLSTTGAYRCSLATSQGLKTTATCDFSPFPGWEGSKGKSSPQIEIDYSVEVCRTSPCEGGWWISVESIRPVGGG